MLKYGRILRNALCITAVSLGFSTGAGATVISFDGLSGNNLDNFGSYYESGFLIAKGAGDIFQGKVYGAPLPSLFLGPNFGEATGVIEVFNGGASFTYLGFDLSDNRGSADYQIQGFHHGALVYLQSGNQNLGGFSTIGSLSRRSIDRLVFTLTANGSSLNIDNIALGTVPEPESWALIIAGFTLVGGTMRRQRRYLSVCK